jgi:uncharacterized membrane protein YphA (DoxX/SURF4 family)
MINAIHILGQVLLGGYFIYNAYLHFKNHRDYTFYASSNKIPVPKLAVTVTGLLLLLGGLGILFNMYLNIAIILFVIFFVLVNFMMHAFWKAMNPGERSTQKIQFLKNTAILGSLLLLY